MQPATALLLAGRRPGIDPLAAHFRVEDKVLIRVGGAPMISRVARTLLAHPDVARVIVLSQEPDALLRDEDTRWMRGEPRLVFQAGGGSVSAAVADAVARHRSYPFLITTADNVLLDRPILDEFLAGALAANADIAVGMVSRRSLLAAYPDAQRTWLKFRRGAYSGANLFWVASDRAAPAFRLWQRIEHRRKRASTITRAFGPLLLILVGLRLVTIHGALRLAGKRLGLTARAVELKIAEACIDVDKPEDHVLASRIIAEREAASARRGDAAAQRPAS